MDRNPTGRAPHLLSFLLIGTSPIPRALLGSRNRSEIDYYRTYTSLLRVPVVKLRFNTHPDMTYGPLQHVIGTMWRPQNAGDMRLRDIVFRLPFSLRWLGKPNRLPMTVLAYKVVGQTRGPRGAMCSAWFVAAHRDPDLR
jgi:hypothetical protein